MTFPGIAGSGACDALRYEANSMWGQTNQQQQASALAKNVEVNQLASADLEHRRKAQEEAKLGRQRLDEMRHVRDKVHAKLRAAKAAGSHETGVASCALARAGQRAMSARGEAQLWDKQAKSTENRAIVAAVREQEALNMVEKGSDIRVAAAKEHLEGRRAKSEQLTSLAQEQGEVSQRQHSEHLEMKERHAAGHGQLKVGAASRAQELAKQEMYTVSAKSGKQQMSVVRDVQRSLEAGSARVSAAQQELAAQEEECQLALAREDLCAAQIKRIASEQTQQGKVDLILGQNRLDTMLQQVTHYAQNKKSPFEEAEKILAVRTEAVNHAADCAQLAARQRVGKEEEEIASRITKTKRLLSDLQAQAAAHVSELLERFEVAKRLHTAQIQEAEKRYEELTSRCQEEKVAREQHFRASLTQTELLAQERQAAVEQRAKVSDELAQQRAAVLQQQSAERRRQAEARLEQMRRHVEDVQARCCQRVLAGKATADEKVLLVRERFAAKVQIAEQRADEAGASRDKARAAYEAVVARCKGAVDEAQRRGLEDIAELLSLPALPASMTTAGSSKMLEGEAAFGDSFPGHFAAGGKNIFKETGSTCFPDHGSTPLGLTQESATS